MDELINSFFHSSPLLSLSHPSIYCSGQPFTGSFTWQKVTLIEIRLTQPNGKLANGKFGKWWSVLDVTITFAESIATTTMTKLKSSKAQLKS